MKTPTLFNGNIIVVDAMVIINFHGLLALEKFISWARKELAVEKRVRKEAKSSLAGPIDLTPYIEDQSIIEEEISGKEQEALFYYYFNRQVGKARIHEPDAACLSLAISKGYGLASDEKVIRDEFKAKCPDKICINSWGIVTKANDLGLVGKEEAENLKKGFFFV